MAMRYRPPEKFVRIFVAQVAEEKDEARYREKVATVERLANEACHESVRDGFVPMPSVAVTNAGNVIVIMGVDPRPLPGHGSNLEIPQGPVPTVLQPPTD